MFACLHFYPTIRGVMVWSVAFEQDGKVGVLLLISV
jgi:hypothetical protein